MVITVSVVPGHTVANHLQSDIRMIPDDPADYARRLHLGKIDLDLFEKNETGELLSRHIAVLLFQFRRIHSLEDDRKLSVIADDEEAPAVGNFTHQAAQHHPTCWSGQAKQKQRSQDASEFQSHTITSAVV